MSYDIVNNDVSVSAISDCGANTNALKQIPLNTGEEGNINAIKIISTFNAISKSEIPPSIAIPNIALSTSVISTPKVSISQPNRIRIISSSDLIGKTLVRSEQVSRIINVPSSGSNANKDVIKFVSAKTVLNFQAQPISSGVSPTKIIRIQTDKDSTENNPLSTLTSSGPSAARKIVTIQSGNIANRTAIQLQLNRNSIKLSPKVGTVTSTTQSSSASNFILLTPANVAFSSKAFDTTSNLLKPIQTSQIKADIYDRYDNAEIQKRRNLQMDSTSVNSNSTWQQYVSQYAHMGPCPICEDSISGYHYGIFCCESCKGFFKRSVQNHKDYVCHVQQSGGEQCGINKHTRKKCPSCRFQRCVDKGMRIEAVRNDRSRGGRSLYPGSRNRVHQYSFSDFGAEDSNKSSTICNSIGSDPSRYVGFVRQLTSSNHSVSSAINSLQPATNIINSLDGSKNLSISTNGPLHRALSSRGRTSMMSVLDNIVIIEEQLQQERDVLGPTMEDDDMAVYRVLLKLAEQRLHRMVRWSRALPEFSAIDTDDQIMLVQNCWAELLILDCCYRSLGDPREIHLTSGKCINLEAACELGAKDIVEFVVRTTEKLKRLKLDLREYACLKVLLLMQPDLRHLKAQGRVRMFQETITQLLLDHTNQHYEAELPNKFYDLIVSVPEIREAANTVKEMLIAKDLSPFLSSNSLLLELLNCNCQSVALSVTSATAVSGSAPPPPPPLPVTDTSHSSTVPSKDHIKIISVSTLPQSSSSSASSSAHRVPTITVTSHSQPQPPSVTAVKSEHATL